MKSRLRFVLQLSFTLLVCLFMIVPVAMSVMAGLTENYFVGLESGLTLRWVDEVWYLYADTIWLSIKLALACLLITILIGVPAAYGLLRSRRRWANAIEELLLLPVAVPGLATALARLRQLSGISRQLAIYSCRTRAVYAALYGSRGALRDADRQASAARRSRRQPGRQLPPALFRRSRSQLYERHSGGRADGGYLIHRRIQHHLDAAYPLTKTLPVGLADSYASMRLEVGSAYTLIFLAMVVPLLVAIQWAGHLTGQRR
ncbi:hypothetical protein HORIV_39890 [Vreelandella olivaria]|uniref:Uncharacterized protein n=1 Tax=Vreelandella olivaria TaxID=390919 RepID=A0ABM7GLB4_9GAMM|nr:hypothetical protein HORIV_39890 [Halomonas olivaria]